MAASDQDMRTPAMIYARDYDDVLRGLGSEFFVSAFSYVQNLASWAKEKGVDLSEPSQPMKLYARGETLTLLVQAEIPGEMLQDVVRALGVRWSLKDNVSDPSALLDSVKKMLVYCFLKEYARILNDLRGDDLLEDEWALREMEKLGFFRE